MPLRHDSAVVHHRPEPDCAALHLELRRRAVTLALLHVEYLAEQPQGLRYTAFCERYREWLKRQSPVMRQVHLAGDKVFVDYSGMKARLVDSVTGEVIEVELFVAVLGASNYTYAEATRTQQVPDFVASIAQALAFLHGVPRAIVPDQLKSAVITACRYDPGVQRTTAELARATTAPRSCPARPRSPRDKAKVEVGVQIAERWLLARIRNETFTTLGALNARLRKLVAELNARTMRTYKASRRELFERLDKPALGPLPAEPFETQTWKQVGLNIDYHVAFEGHCYSAPTPCATRTSSCVAARHEQRDRDLPRTRARRRAPAKLRARRLPRPSPSTCRARIAHTPSGRRRASSRSGPGRLAPTLRALCEVILREPPPSRQWLAIARAWGSFGSRRSTAARASTPPADVRSLPARSRAPRADAILQHNLDGQPLPEPEGSRDRKPRATKMCAAATTTTDSRTRKKNHAERAHPRKTPCPAPARPRRHMARARTKWLPTRSP